MKVNYKQLYAGLKQQAKALRNELTPAGEVEKVNEIPANFNQIGWDLTIEKAELMVAKLKELREVKGNRLTPQFYRSIYNRALIAYNEADKLIEELTAATVELDYELEVTKLNAEIFDLQNKVAESRKAAEIKAAEDKAKEEAEKAEQDALQAKATAKAK